MSRSAKKQILIPHLTASHKIVQIRFMPEQIIGHLREAEVLSAQGLAIGEVCR